MENSDFAATVGLPLLLQCPSPISPFLLTQANPFLSPSRPPPPPAGLPLPLPLLAPPVAIHRRAAGLGPGASQVGGGSGAAAYEGRVFRVAGPWRPLFSAQRGDGAHHAGPLASLLIDDPHLATFNPSTHQSLPPCTGAHIISHYPPSLFHTYIPRFRLPARLVTGLRACAARCCQLADAEGGHDSSPRCGVVWTRVEWTGEDVPHASRPPVESAMHGNYAGSPQPPPSLPLPLPSPAPPGQWRCRWCGRWRCWATATTSCLSLSACVSPRSPSR